MPACATDTWWREIVTPVRAVINNAHDEGLCPPIRVRGYSRKERMEQDAKRGKQSRIEKTPGDREWLAKFMGNADVYNAALAAFMFETAARVGQAVQLRPQDLDLMNGRVWLAESKGHPAQWVAISRAMVVRLANLKAKQPRARAGNHKLPPRVFGYATSTSMHARWRTICRAAGVSYLPPHQAGRHGFYTEMRVRQGLDPISAAKAGRWADPALPDRVYAHTDVDERSLREKANQG
jgi:integrase